MHYTFVHMYIYRYIVAIYPTSEEVESKLGGFAGDHAREGWAFLHSKAGLENISFMVHPCWDLDVPLDVSSMVFLGIFLSKSSGTEEIDAPLNFFHVKTNLRKFFCTFRDACGAASIQPVTLYQIYSHIHQYIAPSIPWNNHRFCIVF